MVVKPSCSFLFHMFNSESSSPHSSFMRFSLLFERERRPTFFAFSDICSPLKSPTREDYQSKNHLNQRVMHARLGFEYTTKQHLIWYISFFLSKKTLRCKIYCTLLFTFHALTHYFVLAVLNVLRCNLCARCAEWGEGGADMGKVQNFYHVA